MVRRGEYLERAVVVDGEAGPIEGLYHRGAKRPPLLILPGHPYEGGAMEIALIAELAWAVTRRGHPTLRINYRGVGASGGTFSGLEGAVSDAARAKAHLLESTGAASSAVLGIGFGGKAAAAVAGADASLLVLVSPPEDALPQVVPDEVLVVLAQAEDPARSRAIGAWVESQRGARLAVIPGADRAFLRGLVELGRVVAEALSPPGLIDLG